MVFNSLHFVAFFLVVYPLYRVLPHRAQNVLLILASYYFYAAWDWRYLGLLVGSTVVDYLVGRYLGRTSAPRRRRPISTVSVRNCSGCVLPRTARASASWNWRCDFSSAGPRSIM